MIEKWFEPFMLLERSSVPDGMGGELLCDEETLPFQGVVTFTAGDSLTLGGQPALRETPVLLHEYDVTLSPGDIVRREKDGAVYRISSRSDSLRAPAFSGLHFAQVHVERVVVPC